MDGLHEMAAGEIPLQVGLKTYRFKIRRASCYAAIEKHLIDQQPDPVEYVKARLAGLNDKQQNYLLGRAYDTMFESPRSIAWEHVLGWMYSARGVSFAVWQGLRDFQPDVTLEAAAAIVDIIGLEAAQQAIDQASALPVEQPTTNPPLGQTQATNGHAPDSVPRGAASSAS